MVDQIQAKKNEIWLAKKQLADDERDRDEWAAQLAVVNGLLEKSGPDAGNEALKAQIEEELEAYEARLAPLREKLAALEAQLPKAPEPPVPKFDPEKHPLLKKTVEKVEPSKPVVFNTGDVCEVLWTDKQWYKAKIQTILGAVSAPKYHVKFLEYDDSMTVDRDAIRSLQNKRKRETEAAPAVVPVTTSPHVISGPASMNPNTQVAKQDPNADKPIPKKRTIGSTKALGDRVDKWKNWTSKGTGKKIAKKESMFRTGTSVNSRVGFTGSGAGMSGTQKRVRYNNKADVEEEEEGGSLGRAPDERRKDDRPLRVRY